MLTDYRDEFEERYFAYTGKAIKIIRRFYEVNLTNNPNTNPGNLVSQNSAHQASKSTSVNSHSTKGFPVIELIKFHGEYDK